MSVPGSSLAPVAVIMDTTTAERGRLVAYASRARLTIDEIALRATMAAVNPNPVPSVVPVAISGDQLLLELIVDTIRESLQVRRGEVLTDEVIAERSRNAAQSVAYALDVALDDETEPT